MKGCSQLHGDGLTFVPAITTFWVVSLALVLDGSLETGGFRARLKVDRWLHR